MMDVSAFGVVDIDTLASRLRIKLEHACRDGLYQLRILITDGYGDVVQEKRIYSEDNWKTVEIISIHWLEKEFGLWGGRNQEVNQKKIPTPLGTDVEIEAIDTVLPRGAVMSHEESQAPWEKEKGAAS